MQARPAADQVRVRHQDRQSARPHRPGNVLATADEVPTQRQPKHLNGYAFMSADPDKNQQAGGAQELHSRQGLFRQLM
jgi:hypothetical protein